MLVVVVSTSSAFGACAEEADPSPEIETDGGRSETGEGHSATADGSSTGHQDSEVTLAAEQTGDPDTREETVAQNNDPCRQPEECTNGGDIEDTLNVMTCFAPWEERPIGEAPPLDPNCAEQGCPSGSVCGAGGRCQASPCEMDAECPEHFTCGSASTCERMTCSADADCDGYCVHGLCSSELGRCGYQTAA